MKHCEMKHCEVKSSMAASIAHKGDVLHVRFKNGKTYEYKGVSAAQFETMQKSDSFGKCLNGMQIKGSLLKPEKNGRS